MVTASDGIYPACNRDMRQSQRRQAILQQKNLKERLGRKTMNGLEYIRDYYKVPSHHNTHIRYTGGGSPRTGVIIGARGPYLRVRFSDGEVAILHPTWEVEYLEPRLSE